MNADTFTYEPRGQMLVIHLPRELDHHNCRNLRYETDLLLSENYITRIIFDFSQTEFMDSSGIGVILGRYRILRDRGGKMAVCHMNPHIARIFHMSGMDRIIPELDRA